MKYLQDVYDFHAKFGIPQPDTPGLPDEEIVSFRLNFLREELVEIEDSIMEDDLEGVLDGLVDLVYVALGTALMFGLDFHAAWERVQEANMKKASGKATGRHPMFDVHKPEGWQPPVLDDLVDPAYRRIAP